MSTLSRREFVKGSILAATALGLKPWDVAQAAGKDIPIAVQLYSVRGDCAKDFDAALAGVAKMGFAGVEFAGYYKYGSKAKDLRAKLDELGLKVAATHIGTGSFRGDALQRTIDFHQTIGCKFLIVPGDGDFTNPEKSKALAETFNKTAEVLKPLNMACGYHNHTGEFKKDPETAKTYYDLFAERTTKDVVLQQDCGWTFDAGLDPVAMMKKYPGRMKSTHFKPTAKGAGKKAYIGQDSVDWVAVLAACREIGGTEWITVEQEVYPDGKSAMECTAISLAGLKKIW
jgi:sugar phosphate isomerase/epimerase